MGYHSSLATAAVAAVLTASCSVLAAPTPPSSAVQWQPCAATSLDSTLPGDIQTRLECAAFSVPSNYAAADGGASSHLSIQLARLPAKNTTTPKGGIYVLPGGPGEAAIGYRSYLASPVFASLNGDHDVTIVELRGTGNSTRLDCGMAVQNATQASACLGILKQQGLALTDFSTDNAARDLNQVITATARAGSTVTVYGLSYGTWLAHRYVQLFPGQATALVLDGLVPYWTRFADSVSTYDDGLAVLGEMCDGNAACKTLYATAGSEGGTTVQKIREVLRNLTMTGTQGSSPPPPANNACYDAVPAELRRMLPLLFTTLANVTIDSKPYDTRVLLLEMLGRLRRCSDAGQDASFLRAATTGLAPLAQSAGAQMQAPKPVAEQPSPLIAVNIVLSEWWTTLADATAAQHNATIANDLAPVLAAVAPVWPTYPAPPRTPLTSRFGGRVLVLSGQLDPQTPVTHARRTVGEMKAGGVDVVSVEMPRGAHITSLMQMPCAVGSIEGFVRKGTGAVDAGTCLGDGLDFSVLTATTGLNTTGDGGVNAKSVPNSGTSGAVRAWVVGLVTVVAFMVSVVA
ncbi:Alpha/Beta hydrolase protein [Fimicolochytrium jonesii]|uniref:Alpha/Beta hydrolase protein n=1 Tax=Fimicolochytrium jonesii TaxID=1396493 RepID=UPI0022FDB3AC|nr:Alpha/Beta hydrolase protein [Fimicolochytrium jonesii]KAI8816244.1 Alpha/Beta hydrolase protein [Fimicolochytrium jonesii]